MRVLAFAMGLSSLALLAACGKKEAPPESLGLPPVATAQEALAQLPAQYQGADLDNGKSKLNLCRSCHTFTDGGPNGVGPNLYRVFGRKAGSKPDFKYSDAVKKAGFTWDADHLDQWLTKPKDFIPGTKMTFQGLPDASDRRDLIAALKVQTGTIPPKQ
ncbi:MAG TPA: cytochrome c family protein [Caulobacteraceae bacterium]|nr:cytochrome c family protein [Caulobacteraceae bacterium]